MNEVRISWKKIYHNKLSNINKDFLKQNIASLEDLKRSVYVIKLDNDFAIHYKKKISPVIYIGEGNFPQRIINHQIWFSELEELIKAPLMVELHIATPRRQNNKNLYKDLEAFLLHKFKDIYGQLPLINKQLENVRKSGTTFTPFRSILGIGSGKNFKWAIYPLKSNKKLYNLYLK